MTKNNFVSILDDRSALKKLDPSGALESAESLADQIKQVWDEKAQIKFDAKKIDDIDQVVIVGMGGSALGADIIISLFKDLLTVPVIINGDYTLPSYVGNETLVVLSSYSGNTEEVLSCATAAEAKGAQIAIISAGGKLATIAREKKYPQFLIDAKHNPSQQPRMAIAYSVMAFICMFEAAGLLDFSEEQFLEIITIINRSTEECAVNIEQEKNQAKMLAFLSLERRPILVGAEFLTGALHLAANQFNENAKTFADYKIIPELNHHLLEGLTFPKSNPLNHFFIFFQSKLYHPRNQKRLELTKKLLVEKDIESIVVNLVSENKLTQVFELITLTSFSSLYLAFLEKIDPCLIPSVDWFKKKLIE